METKDDVLTPRTSGNGRPSLTRDEILAAAARLIVTRGYGACTMRAVAEQVEIKAGSLYHHFTSKEQIIKEILNSGLEMLLDQVQQKLQTFPRDASFAERVEAAIEVHVANRSSREAGFMHVYEHLPPVLKRESNPMRKKYAQLWFDLFRDGVRRGEVDSDLDLKIFVPYFLGGLNRVPEWFHSVGAEARDVAHLAFKVLMDGVGIERRSVSTIRPSVSQIRRKPIRSSKPKRRPAST